jgi:cytochrome c oxidase subunit 2
MGWTLPENISTFGGEIDHLFYLISWITGLTLVATFAVLGYSILKFRHKPGVKAQHIHGSHKVEIIWTLVPAGILLFLALYQTKTWARIKMDIPASPDNVTVQVFAKQFEWNFRLPGTDGQFGTEDDIYTINDLHIPRDRNVVLEMRSYDVIHSLFMPHLRYKQDIMPGMTIRGWFQSTKSTEQARTERGNPDFKYEIACTELCGLGHHEMRAKVTIDSPSDFDAWVAKESAAAADFAPPELWENWGRAGGILEIHDLEGHGGSHDDHE